MSRSSTWISSQLKSSFVNSVPLKSPLPPADMQNIQCRNLCRSYPLGTGLHAHARTHTGTRRQRQTDSQQYSS